MLIIQVVVFKHFFHHVIRRLLVDFNPQLGKEHKGQGACENCSYESYCLLFNLLTRLLMVTLLTHGLFVTTSYYVIKFGESSSNDLFENLNLLPVCRS